jgi:hypothetical protein
MVQGFVADFAHARVVVSTWVEGPPEKSFWHDTKVPQEKVHPYRYVPLCRLRLP